MQRTFFYGFDIWLCVFLYANDLVSSSFKKVVAHQTQEQWMQSRVHMCAVITVYCQIKVIVDIIASGLPFTSCINLTSPVHASTPQPLPGVRVVYFAFCAHNPPASTYAPACPQVSLLRGIDPQNLPCKTSLQLRKQTYALTGSEGSVEAVGVSRSHVNHCPATCRSRINRSPCMLPCLSALAIKRMWRTMSTSHRFFSRYYPSTVHNKKLPQPHI